MADMPEFPRIGQPPEPKCNDEVLHRHMGDKDDMDLQKLKQVEPTVAEEMIYGWSKEFDERNWQAAKKLERTRPHTQRQKTLMEVNSA